MLSDYTKDGIRRTAENQAVQANYDRKRLDACTAADFAIRGVLVYQIGGWHVYTFELIAERTTYTRTADRVVIIHPRTWATLSHDIEVQGTFLRNTINGASGMRFLNMDGGDYAKAAMLEAKRNGTDVVVAKDLLTSTAEAAARLITQAAGLTQQPTPGQLQIFFQQHAELEDQLVVLEERMAKLRHLVNLAGETVTGAA